MSHVLIDFDAERGIGTLTFNRPEVLNALDAATAGDFLVAVRTLTAMPGLRCVVLTGAGRAFAAGGDVATFTANGIERAPEVIHALLDPLNTAILALRQHPAPVIAAVKGVAAGAGLSLALSGDLILAEEKARFVVAYDRVGAPPDCGMGWFLPQRVGRGLAFEMMLTGRNLTAPEALACRLVDRVAHADEFDGALVALAQRVASGPTLAYGHFKTLMDAGLGLAEHLEAERRAFIETTRSADFAEGVAAFIAKREPAFRGQ